MYAVQRYYFSISIHFLQGTNFTFQPTGMAGMTDYPLLRLQLVGGRRQLFPSLAKSIVSVGHHHKGTRVGFLYLQFHTRHFLITHDKEKHFLFRTGIEAAALNASGRTVEFFQYIIVQLRQTLIADDKYQLIILGAIYRISNDTGNDEYGYQRIK